MGYASILKDNVSKILDLVKTMPKDSLNDPALIEAMNYIIAQTDKLRREIHDIDKKMDPYFHNVSYANKYLHTLSEVETLQKNSHTLKQDPPYFFVPDNEVLSPFESLIYPLEYIKNVLQKSSTTIELDPMFQTYLTNMKECQQLISAHALFEEQQIIAPKELIKKEAAEKAFIASMEELSAKKDKLISKNRHLIYDHLEKSLANMPASDVIYSNQTNFDAAVYKKVHDLYHFILVNSIKNVLSSQSNVSIFFMMQPLLHKRMDFKIHPDIQSTKQKDWTFKQWNLTIPSYFLMKYLHSAIPQKDIDTLQENSPILNAETIRLLLFRTRFLTANLLSINNSLALDVTLDHYLHSAAIKTLNLMATRMLSVQTAPTGERYSGFINNDKLPPDHIFTDISSLYPSTIEFGGKNKDANFNATCFLPLEKTFDNKQLAALYELTRERIYQNPKQPFFSTDEPALNKVKSSAAPSSAEAADLQTQQHNPTNADKKVPKPFMPQLTPLGAAKVSESETEDTKDFQTEQFNLTYAGIKVPNKHGLRLGPMGEAKISKSETEDTEKFNLTHAGIKGPKKYRPQVVPVVEAKVSKSETEDTEKFNLTHAGKKTSKTFTPLLGPVVEAEVSESETEDTEDFQIEQLNCTYAGKKTSKTFTPLLVPLGETQVSESKTEDTQVSESETEDTEDFQIEEFNRTHAGKKTSKTFTHLLGPVVEAEVSESKTEDTEKFNLTYYAGKKVPNKYRPQVGPVGKAKPIESSTKVNFDALQAEQPNAKCTTKNEAPARPPRSNDTSNKKKATVFNPLEP